MNELQWHPIKKLPKTYAMVWLYSPESKPNHVIPACYGEGEFHTTLGKPINPYVTHWALREYYPDPPRGK